MDEHYVYIVKSGCRFEGGSVEKVFANIDEAREYVNMRLDELNQEEARHYDWAVNDWKEKCLEDAKWATDSGRRAVIGGPLEERYFKKEEIEGCELCYRNPYYYISVMKYVLN